MIKQADPSREYMTLKSLEAYEKLADGKATKLVVPAELQQVATLLTSAKEMISEPKQ